MTELEQYQIDAAAHVSAMETLIRYWEEWAYQGPVTVTSGDARAVAQAVLFMLQRQTRSAVSDD